jgi:hypothetical protein
VAARLSQISPSNFSRSATLSVRTSLRTLLTTASAAAEGRWLHAGVTRIATEPADQEVRL